jgi:hypothetical protein
VKTTCRLAFYDFFIFSAPIPCISLECMEKEAAEYGDQAGMNRTALGTIKLFYNEDDLRQAGGKLSNGKVTKVYHELLVFGYHDSKYFARREHLFC